MWPLLVCISDWNKNILSSFVEDHQLKCRSESVEVFLLFVYICIIVGRSNYQELTHHIFVPVWSQIQHYLNLLFIKHQIKPKNSNIRTFYKCLHLQHLNWQQCICTNTWKDRLLYLTLRVYRGRMVVGFTTTCANRCLSPLMLRVRIPLMVRCTRYNIMR